MSKRGTREQLMCACVCAVVKGPKYIVTSSVYSFLNNTVHFHSVRTLEVGGLFVVHVCAECM